MNVERLYTGSGLAALRDAVHKTALDHGWWEGFQTAEVPFHTPTCNSWSQGAPCDCPPRESRKGALVFGPGVLDEKLFLVATELAEAFEVYREGIAFDEIWVSGDSEKPEGFPVEMADAYIRVLDIMGAKQLEIANTDLAFMGCGQLVGRQFMMVLKYLAHSNLAVSDRGVGENLSTVLACIESISYELKFDLKKAIELKMAYNETRPYRHGNKKA